VLYRDLASTSLLSIIKSTNLLLFLNIALLAIEGINKLLSVVVGALLITLKLRISNSRVKLVSFLSSINRVASVRNSEINVILKNVNYLT
jgi:hypothetical protein